MPYVSVYSFNCKSIALIVYVAYMLTRINYINIAPISDGNQFSVSEPFF